MQSQQLAGKEIILEGARRSELLSLIVVNATVDALSSNGITLTPTLAAMQEHYRVEPMAMTSRRLFLEEVETVLAAHKDPAIGLVIGESLNEMSFHFIGPLIAGQPSLRQTTEMFLQIANTVIGGPTWELAISNDEVIVGYKGEPELGPCAVRVAEMAITTIWRSLSHLLGIRARGAITAQFAHAAPPYVQRYRELFGTHLHFEQRLSGVRYPAALFSNALPGASKELSENLRELGQPFAQLDQTSWTDRVREHLANTDKLAALSFEDIAQECALSPRTLRRRLAREKASFMMLLEEARMTRAKELLLNDEHSLTQISNLLGYWEVNSFQRAFKRWVGIPPGSYRQRVRHQPK